MTKPDTITEIRQQLLSGKGIIPPAPKLVSKATLRVRARVNTTDSSKTPAMRVIETLLGKPIEELISGDKNGAEVAYQLGVTRSTISKWRTQLGIKPKFKQESNHK
jgi:hypothetical protein